MKLSKILNAAYVTFAIFWSVWVIASICDVGFHNKTPDPVYQDWNLINVGDAS